MKRLTLGALAILTGCNDSDSDRRLDIIETRLERLEAKNGIAPERISEEEMGRLTREGKAR